MSWSLKAVPWSLAIHVAQRFWQTFPEEEAVPDSAASVRRRQLLARIGVVLQLLFALTLVPLFIVVLVLTLVLGLLPIPQLRSVILSAQSVLTGTMGDSLAFVESPVRAALIRTRILKSLERLIGQCDHTMVVAHSQGAAAVLDALGGIANSKVQGKHTGPVPNTLLTFGAGINQLVSLKVMLRDLPGTVSLSTNPASLGVFALLATVILVTWLVRDLRDGRTTISAVLHAGAAFAIAFATIGTVVAATKRWIKVAALQKLLIYGVGVLVVTGLHFYSSSRAELPMGTVYLIVLAAVGSIASLALILSAEIRRAVTAPVREPVGLDRWVDFYASADPVPNGPTRIMQPRILTCIPIWNRGSIFSDHTAYWQNLDGFALRVARECAKRAGSSWSEALPAETRDVDRRAAWRLGYLRLSLWTTRLAWLSVLLILWSRHGLVVPLPVEVPHWVPFGSSTFTEWTAVPILIVAAAWLTARLLFLVWALWTRAEQRATLAHTPPTDRALTPVFALGLIVGLATMLPYALSRESWFTVLEAMADPGPLLNASPAALGWGAILALIAVWRMPPPRPS